VFPLTQDVETHQSLSTETSIPILPTWSTQALMRDARKTPYTVKMVGQGTLKWNAGDASLPSGPRRTGNASQSIKAQRKLRPTKPQDAVYNLQSLFSIQHWRPYVWNV